MRRSRSTTTPTTSARRPSRASRTSTACKVEVSTFNDGDEAITKLRSGVDFDIYNANYTEISRLVTGGLVRPLNHSYIPNISNVWPTFTNPWYDQGWQYTVPYTIYTTGIGWRTDQVPADIGALKNPYESLWDPQYKDKTAILDDWHTAMAMVLLKQGITDVNTSSADDLKMVGEQLTALVKATSPKVTITMYSDLPAGQIGLCQMWSGDIINAQSYLPEGVGPDILRYWFPQDGKGLVDNDMLVTLKGGKNPVLAHLFLNHMLDPAVAKENFSAIGYQPPQNTITRGLAGGRGVHPREPAVGDRQAGVLRRRLPDAGTRAPTMTLPGTTSGMRSTPADPDRTECVQQRARTHQPAVGGPGRTGYRLAAAVLPRAALRGARDRLRPGRSALPHRGSGVESVAVEPRLSSSTCSPGSAPAASTSRP